MLQTRRRLRSANWLNSPVAPMEDWGSLAGERPCVGLNRRRVSPVSANQSGLRPGAGKQGGTAEPPSPLIWAKDCCLKRYS
jgi:hypothetical protein